MMGSLPYVASLVAVVITAVTMQLLISNRWSYSSESLTLLEDGAWTARLERLGDRSVLDVSSDDLPGVIKALGFAHARDRLVQMVMLRSIASARLSLDFADTPDTNQIDLVMNEFGFANLASEATKLLSADHLAYLQEYSNGINLFLKRHGHQLPIEFTLTGHVPRPWVPEDSLITALIMTIVGLADVHLDMQKMLIESIASGRVALQPLKTLFAPHLDAVDETLAQLWAKVHIRPSTLPDDVTFGGILPGAGLAGSNCWAVSGDHTKSGKPMLAADPHLNVLRLPAIWYEARWSYKSAQGPQTMVGIGMPGVPLMIMGRNNHLAWGFTYGYGDQFDYFVEEVKAGQYRVSGGWEPLQQRRELVQRKAGNNNITAVFFSTANGIIERPIINDDPIADGFYLARASSITAKAVAGGTMEILDASCASSSIEFAAYMRNVAMSSNSIVIDDSGDIAYQQTGNLPVRRTDVSAFVALPGWESKNVWDKGRMDPELLGYIINPPGGVLVSANNDVEEVLALGGAGESDVVRPLTIGMSMGPYRFDRIRSMISESGDHMDEEDMVRMQRDVVYPALLREGLLAPVGVMLKSRAAAGSETARQLIDWAVHGRMDGHSSAATIFVTYHEMLIAEVLGGHVFGREAWVHLQRSVVNVVFASRFDRALLEENLLGAFPTPADKAHMFERVLATVLDKFDAAGGAPKLYERHSLVMRNILFDGKPPFNYLGFDHGPIKMSGGPNVVVQSSTFDDHGRPGIFGQSWRFISNLASDFVLSSLPGGPSGNRFTDLYKLGIDEHFAFRYHRTAVARSDE